MARIGENAFRQYRDGQDRLTAPEYMAERELIRLAVNDLDDKIQRTEGIREEFSNTVNEVEVVKEEFTRTKHDVESSITDFTQTIGQATQEIQQAKEEVSQFGARLDDKASKEDVQEVTLRLEENSQHKIERINIVERYGVDNTGVSDCTTAIKNVLADGKIPYLPPGTYLHNGLTLTNPIFGDGATLKYTGTGAGVVFNTPNIKADGITFTSTGLDTALVKITAPLEVSFHNCEFIGSGGYGIQISGVVHSLIFSGRCTVKNNASHGIFATDIKRASFLGCLVSGNGGYGIYFDGYSHGPIFEMNQIWGNLMGGVYLQGEKEGDVGLKFSPVATSSQHPIFLGNHIDHNQDDVDTTKPSYGIYLDGVELPILVGNLVRTSRTEGIRVENSSYGLMIGNQVWKIESGKAITLTSTTSRFTLLGNAYPSGSLTVANSKDHTILGVDSGKNFIYGELSLLDKLSFSGAGGFLKQYATGGGAGNMELDMNSTTGRTLAVKNGTNDMTFDIQGKTLKLKDENGVSRVIRINAAGQLTIT